MCVCGRGGGGGGGVTTAIAAICAACMNVSRINIGEAMAPQFLGLWKVWLPHV